MRVDLGKFDIDFEKLPKAIQGVEFVNVEGLHWQRHLPQTFDFPAEGGCYEDVRVICAKCGKDITELLPGDVVEKLLEQVSQHDWESNETYEPD